MLDITLYLETFYDSVSDRYRINIEYGTKVACRLVLFNRSPRIRRFCRCQQGRHFEGCNDGDELRQRAMVTATERCVTGLRSSTR